MHFVVMVQQEIQEHYAPGYHTRVRTNIVTNNAASLNEPEILHKCSAIKSS